jgi:transcriptional regulator with XRE-family HTH domain
VRDTEGYLRAFGKRIEQLREQRGLDRARFAETSGLDLGELEQIERGELSPNLAILRRLAGSLELPLSELFEGVDEPGSRDRDES